MKVNWHRVWFVIEKEWAEFRKNRMILALVALLPIVLMITALGSNGVMTYSIMTWGDDMRQQLDSSTMSVPEHLQHLDPLDVLAIQINEQLMFAFLLIPMTLPVYIAAYAIIGEKQAKTLEPLLATPISTWELLAGKSIAATSLPVIVTWGSYAVALVGSGFVTSTTVFAYTARPAWILAMLLLCPLLAFLSTLCGVIVSSRLNDPRVAQQVMAIFIIPFLAGSIALLLGWIFFDVPVVLMATLFTLVVDLVVLYLAVKVFQRETILTRWK